MLQLFFITTIKYNCYLGNIQHHRLVRKEQRSIERHRCRSIQKGIEQVVGRDLR